jgi:hypothetical protein
VPAAPLRLPSPQDGRRRTARRRELPEVAPGTRATMPAPRRDVRSTSDGGSAVLSSGLSYTAHWEALGCALCLLTASAIPLTGPVRGRGFCPGSHRPRACVPLVVCGPGTSLLYDFYAVVSRPPPVALSLNVSGLSYLMYWSPGPCSPTVFRSAICDCLSTDVSPLFRPPHHSCTVCEPSQNHSNTSLSPCGDSPPELCSSDPRACMRSPVALVLRSRCAPTLSPRAVRFHGT